VRRFRTAIVAAGLALAIAAEWSAFEPGKLEVTIADGVVGVVLLVCGVIAWERVVGSRTGPLMVVAGLTWFAGTLAPAALFWHRGPLVHVIVSYPTGRLGRRLAVATVVLAYVDAIVEPIARNNFVPIVLAALVVAAAADGFARTSGPARRAAVPALGAALAYAGLLAAGALARLAGWDADGLVLFGYDAVVATVAVVLLVDLLRGPWTKAAVADLVVALGRRGGRGTLQEQLARALGDPSLVVGYWIGEQAGYVDDLGRPVNVPQPGEGRAVTAIEDDVGRVAILVHDATTVEDPRLVASVAAAARLAVVNARMQAEARARVAELAASRRRVVESADEQRLRLEHELADGAERRLDEVLRLLDEAGWDARCSDALGLMALADELRSARAELHDVAQGIRPPTLREGGLTAALPLLADRAPVPVRLTVGVGRLRPAVEAAVYFVCSEALTNVAKHAMATEASVAVFEQQSMVVARVVDDGVGGVDPSLGSGLRGLADRVEALGGQFLVEDSDDCGTVVTATLPMDDTECPPSITSGGSTT
jgi:signal transduction histidine kinase